MRVGEQFLQAQAVGPGAEALAVGAEAQHHVEPAFGSVLAGEPRGEFLRVAFVDGSVRVLDGLAEGGVDDHGVHGGRVGAVHAGGGEHQPGEDLGLGHAARFEGTAGRL